MVMHPLAQAKDYLKRLPPFPRPRSAAIRSPCPSAFLRRFAPPQRGVIPQPKGNALGTLPQSLSSPEWAKQSPSQPVISQRRGQALMPIRPVANAPAPWSKYSRARPTAKPSAFEHSFAEDPRNAFTTPNVSQRLPSPGGEGQDEGEISSRAAANKKPAIRILLRRNSHDQSP